MHVWYWPAIDVWYIWIGARQQQQQAGEEETVSALSAAEDWLYGAGAVEESLSGCASILYSAIRA